jgi:hypothetical protein
VSPMLALTRKRVNDRPATWYVHYAGVRVGVIVERSGAPPSSDQWQWCCGFYPGAKSAQKPVLYPNRFSAALLCLSQRAASVPKALPNRFRALPAFAVTISPIIRLLA